MVQKKMKDGRGGGEKERRPKGEEAKGEVFFF